MDNLATIEPSSTTLDPGAVSPTAAGGGTPTIPNEAPSLRDSIEAAVKEVSQPDDKADVPGSDEAKKAETAKAPPKADEKPKGEKTDRDDAKEPVKAPDRSPDGKFAARAEGTNAEGDNPEEAERPTQVKQGLSQAPSKFLPDAKEKWANTPRPVQRDVENLIREREAEAQQYRETSDRYERIRPFDELARSNGRELRESLEQIHQFENMMRQNPIAALNMALMETGPRKADGQPYSLFEIAQAVVQQGPDAYQRMMAQNAPAQEREDPRIAQLQQQLQEVQLQSLTAQVIDPFKADHPRYDELADHIAMFLQSGMIPKTLSLHDRLAAAYDMAERLNPSSHVPQADPNDPGPGPETRRADADFSGTKSIKSAPGSITPDEEPERGGSIREQLERAIRTQRRA